MTIDGPVIYFVRRWPASSEAFIREEIRFLRAKGHDVSVFSVMDAGPDSDVEARESFKDCARILWPPRWVILGVALFSWLGRKPGFFCRLVWRVMRGTHKNLRELGKNLILVALGAYAAYLLERTFRPSRLHAHFAYSGAVVARVAAGFLGGRYSLTVHHSDILFPEGLADLKLAAANPLVTISEYNRRHMLKTWPWLDPAKIKVIYLGVDTVRFAPAREGVKDHGGPMRLLTVARMASHKDPLALVAAARQLRVAGLDFVWRWIGNGPLMPDVRDAISEAGVANQLELCGWVSHSRTPSYFSWADIFVLGSRSEGLPLVLMEAMSSGLAVVSTDVTGVPELVTAGVDGLLVPAGNPTALADAIAGLIKNSEERRRLGRAARNRVVRDFDLTINAERLWDAFSNPD